MGAVLMMRVGVLVGWRQPERTAKRTRGRHAMFAPAFFAPGCARQALAGQPEVVARKIKAARAGLGLRRV